MEPLIHSDILIETLIELNWTLNNLVVPLIENIVISSKNIVF